MKELLKKVFNKKTSTPIFVGFGAFAIFTFIVFPGLTTANTIINILSGIIGLFSLLFIFYYIKADEFLHSITHIEPGETELDYINPEELKPKKKSILKKENPIVKTQKRK